MKSPDKRQLPTALRRTTCAQCLYPLRTCICHIVTHVTNNTPVVIIQHPQETGHAKGTATLLHLCITHSTLVIAETISEQAWQAILDAYPGKTPVLLYPDLPSLPPPATSIPATPGDILLVVIDATWKKSRKMLYINSCLQSLPRMPLVAPPASGYTIRKAHQTGQLSTLEATCYALADIEQHPARYQPVLEAFHTFVATRHALVPAS